MKHLLTALVVFCGAALGQDTADGTAEIAVAAVKHAAANQASVSQCFKVHRLLKTDSTHYWADWSNTCPYTIEAVYVMVGFRDQSRREMGNGVWPMYFVTPGTHRVTRFSAPVADFETVQVHGITTDSALALKPDPGPAIPARAEAAPSTVGDNAVGAVAAAGPSLAPASAPPAASGVASTAKPLAAKPAAPKPVSPKLAAAKPKPRARKSVNRTKY